MTPEQVTSAIQSAQQIADTILKTIEGAAPSVALPAATVETVVDLSAQLVSAALVAWSNASGTEITADSIAALLPNPTPLSEPTA